jgi:hypothetical protein
VSAYNFTDDRLRASMDGWVVPQGSVVGLTLVPCIEALCNGMREVKGIYTLSKPADAVQNAIDYGSFPANSLEKSLAERMLEQGQIIQFNSNSFQLVGDHSLLLPSDNGFASETTTERFSIATQRPNLSASWLVWDGARIYNHKIYLIDHLYTPNRGDRDKTKIEFFNRNKPGDPAKLLSRVAELVR